MKATEARLLTFVQGAPQLVIPIYQRTYSWSEKQCRQLWDDIVRAGSTDEIDAHFVGSVVYVEGGLYQVTGQQPLLVIDGQQRLTTVTLILAALERVVGESAPVPGFSADKIRGYYLTNPLEDGDGFFKLLLSQTDDASMRAVVQTNEAPAEASIRISENFALFQALVAEHADAGTLEQICTGLSKLMVVDVSLDRSHDNPQLVFESMNSTGKELSQADLIRNFILMGLDPKFQTSLYEKYWRPMEIEFGQEAYGESFDAFMRHFLTVRTGEIPREREVYEAFKHYARGSFASDEGVEALVADIRDFSRYFCAVALGAEQDSELGAIFQDLREYKVDVTYPFLLELYADYASGILPHTDLATIARYVESYAFRRSVCSIPTNSMNKTFATFMKNVDKSQYLESVVAQFLLLPSYRRFPTNEEFHQEIQRRDLYNFNRRSYWLRKLENEGRKERAPVDEFTIEHIMPQNPNLPAAWREALGADWESVQAELIHTLGNLTLTGYNTEYSDRPFTEKRDMVGGFRESPLRLNQGLGALETWDQNTIRARASRLADQATVVWARPALDDAVLDSYRPKAKASGVTYGLEDHQYLEDPTLRLLFESLRNQILSLDPCVVEEFKKYYIAYKAESNFVDIVPQASRLRLSLNMPFRELDDPRRLCRDITDIGRQGNGDVDLMVSSSEEIPYAMSLISQSLERQLGDQVTG